MRGSLKSSLRVLVLVLGILAIGNVASSDIMRSTRGVFFPEPIPCHVYLKVKHSVETHSGYVPDSFFQVKVEFLRIETDIIIIQAKKDFLQAQLESYEEQDPNRDIYAEKVEKSLETIEDDHKAVILHVVETLEGSVPNEEIVFSLSSRSMSLSTAQVMIKNKATRYLLGYQSERYDGRIVTASVDRNDLYERDDWFLTDIKRWVRWLFSECDTV